MYEEVYEIEPYAERDRACGSGPRRNDEFLEFNEDMYSLFFISCVKPCYKKYCEEHAVRDKIKAVFKKVLTEQDE